jgi:hypothetical protein
VLDDVREGRVVRIYKERTRHGQAWVVLIGDKTETSKSDRAVAWMIEHDQLARRPFFEACPWAGNSASLHHRAVTRIARAGHAEKIAGTWVLKDHAKALAWLRGGARNG